MFQNVRKIVPNNPFDWVLAKLTLYQWTLLYLVSLSFIGSAIIFSLEHDNPRINVTYIDALFTAASAVSVTGLSSVNFADFNLSSQIVVMILIQMGGVIFTTLFPPLVRRYQLKHKYILPRNAKVSSPPSTPNLTGHEALLPPKKHKRSYSEPEIIYKTDLSDDEDVHLTEMQHIEPKLVPDDDFGACPAHMAAPPATELQSIDRESTWKKLIKYGKPTVTPDLGYEYKAIGKILIVVPCYIITTYLLIFLILGMYLTFSDSAQEILKKNSVGSWWFSFFHVISAFNNAGFGLFADNLLPFSNDRFVLVITSFLIFLGNTAFPIVLRVIVYLLRKYSNDPIAYKYLLVRPRECYTHLFPAKMTRILFVSWAALFVTEFIFFIALDWQNEAIVNYSSGIKILLGYFQAASTRTAGFNAVALGILNHGTLIFYVLMMYVSVYPLAYSIRASDKAQKWRELSTESRYKSDLEAETVPRTATGERKIRSVVKNRLSLGSIKRLLQSYGRKLALRDVTWIYLGIFLICTIESTRIFTDAEFTVFKIVFECVSAYGTVGLSLGYSTTPASFSAVLTHASKLVLCVVMVLGRLRGLPDSLDFAVIPRSKGTLEQSLHAEYQQN